MTIDTACSGSLVGLDVACRYLSTGEINGAIVGASQLFLSPEHVMDSEFMQSELLNCLGANFVQLER